ncbi:uncharacterized protein LOC117648371 isoform X2 [Thrips palmi]|uniref:Uncharacterized protein LOC117648371 isoform X2 n=1 Tax=Thrips palmi TaxID=161013 RepID=A0A6P8Z8G7_THRPL|nr:uncharacterized protein LOC117648371 isoform X2 [Thrips palmi]
MATTLVLLLAAAAVAVVGVAGTAPRTLKPKAHPLLGASLGAAADATQDCQSQLARCTDCTTLLTCTRLGAVYRPLTTTACSGTTPYCSNGACVAALPDNCSAEPAADTTFTCNGDGYFPSPSDCKKYYLCANNQAYAYDCTPYSNTVFSYEKALCVPKSQATCNTVTCNNNNVGTYQQWSSEHSVYFVCTDNNAAHAYVADCGANHAITADGDCALACLREGRLPDESSPDRYFECIQTATNTFTDPIPGTCPAGTTFDACSERCVSTGSSDQPDDSGHDTYAPSDSVPESLYQLPADLKIGTATAAYQIEGAWNVSGKSPSIWDVFFHSRPGMDNGDVADDSYHKWQEDVQLLVDLGVDMYRFSLAWTRVLPGGSQANGANQDGVDYYNNLINTLISNNIEPVITIHHWDIPQIYQDEGGWMTAAIQDHFVDFADFAFKTFGDRVKTWILMNEPNIFCNNAYEGSNFAPGLGLTGTGGYGCVHNQILAHAKAYHLYNDTYRATQQGQVGSSLDLEYQAAASTNPEDVEAAERANTFSYAWFFDPVTVGDYPAVMREVVDRNSFGNGLTVSRLPTFTAEEKRILPGTVDFLGVNHYGTTTIAAGTATSAVTSASITNDTNVSSKGYSRTAPWGLRGALNWIKNRYNNLPILISENGHSGPADEGLNDPDRERYYSAGELKLGFPYVFTGVQKVSTKFGMRVRVDMVDHSLLEKNRVHFFAGGRFNNMTDDEIASLQKHGPHKQVLVYEGVLSGTCVYNLHKVEKFERELARIKREAVMPTPEPYVPFVRAEPNEAAAAAPAAPSAPPLPAAFDPQALASIISASVAAAMKKRELSPEPSPTTPPAKKPRKSPPKRKPAAKKVTETLSLDSDSDTENASEGAPIETAPTGSGKKRQQAAPKKKPSGKKVGYTVTLDCESDSDIASENASSKKTQAKKKPATCTKVVDSEHDTDGELDNWSV